MNALFFQLSSNRKNHEIKMGKTLETNMTSDKGDEKSSPFHLMVADHIFDLLTNPDRDPDGFAHIVNDNFCRLKAQYPEYTRERTEKEIRAMLNDLAKNGRDYFLFYDRVKGKS